MGQARLNDYVAIGQRYAKEVVSGKIPACIWVRRACQRQIDDRKRKQWRYRFDRDKANRICQFIELLPHIKGQWTTKTIKLEPWQCFILTTLFGWVDRDTKARRFQKALIVVPRKNAKSTIAAAVGLFLLAVDGEPGAEVYSAATTRDQAKIVWDIAKKMAQRTKPFCDRYGISPLAHSIAIEDDAAFFKPLSRDADTLEGLNPHGAIIDELHAHKTREVFDVLDDATGSRRQPLIFAISTEGDNPTGVFAEQVSYAEQLLERNHSDETYFAVLYSIDKEDDWTLPLSWKKANPNYGVSVSEESLRTRCEQARKNPASQSSFLMKRLNVRVGAGLAYFNMLAWKACGDPSIKIEDFYGERCIVGLDLASRDDIAAKIYLFGRDSKQYVFGKYYLPEDRLERGNPNYDFYRGWAEKELITFTPGNVIDFAFIEADLLEDSQNFNLHEVACDPAQSLYLSTRLITNGLPMVKVPQNVMRLSEPMKEISALSMQGRLIHNGDPVLHWMMSNVIAKVDANENVFPRKPRPEAKIDGPVALIMAEASMIVLENEPEYTGLRSVG